MEIGCDCKSEGFIKLVCDATPRNTWAHIIGAEARIDTRNFTGKNSRASSSGYCFYGPCSSYDVRSVMNPAVVLKVGLYM